MKECDILRRGAKHTITHLTYFQGVRTHHLSMIYDPGRKFDQEAERVSEPDREMVIAARNAMSLLFITRHDSYKYALKTFPISICGCCRFYAPPLIGGGH